MSIVQRGLVRGPGGGSLARSRSRPGARLPADGAVASAAQQLMQGLPFVIRQLAKHVLVSAGHPPSHVAQAEAPAETTHPCNWVQCPYTVPAFFSLLSAVLNESTVRSSMARRILRISLSPLEGWLRLPPHT